MNVRSIIDGAGIESLASAVQETAKARALDWLIAVYQYDLAQECLAQIESLGASGDTWLLNAKAEYDRLLAARQATSERSKTVQQQIGERQPLQIGTAENTPEGMERVRTQLGEEAGLNSDSIFLASQISSLNQQIDNCGWRKLELEVQKLQAIPRPSVPASILAELQGARKRHTGGIHEAK
jgi:hypothetical protein